MTFREFFKEKYGYDIVRNTGGFIVPCPHKYNLEQKDPDICRRMLDCKACWEREVPEIENLGFISVGVAKDNVKKTSGVGIAQKENGDAVNHPSHYTHSNIECIDAIDAATEGLSGAEAVCVAQVIKYVWRWKWKNGVEDLQKARWYLDRLIASAKKNEQQGGD